MPGKLSSLIGSIRRKPTRAADGRSDVAAGGSNNKKTTLGEDVKHLGLKNAKFVASAITTLASGDPMDDKEFLLENGVAMLQSLPLNSGLSETVSDGFISMLWDDLPHPPPTAAGPTTRYRKHDGSGNNPWRMYRISKQRNKTLTVNSTRNGQGRITVFKNCASSATQGTKSTGCRVRLRDTSQARGGRIPQTPFGVEPAVLFVRYHSDTRNLPDKKRPRKRIHQRNLELRRFEYLVRKHREGAATCENVRDGSHLSRFHCIRENHDDATWCCRGMYSDETLSGRVANGSAVDLSHVFEEPQSHCRKSVLRK